MQIINTAGSARLSVYVRIDRRRKLPATILLRALGLEAEEILELFFDNDTFSVNEEGYSLSLIANRMRGETAQFDITDGKGNVLVPESTRITARHIREMEKLKLKALAVPSEYVCGHRLAKNLIDEETGEIVVPCNAVSRQNDRATASFVHRMLNHATLIMRRMINHVACD